MSRTAAHLIISLVQIEMRAAFGGVHVAELLKQLSTTKRASPEADEGGPARRVRRLQRTGRAASVNSYIESEDEATEDEDRETEAEMDTVDTKNGLLQRVIQVWAADLREWRSATVVQFDGQTDRHKVLYSDDKSESFHALSGAQQARRKAPFSHSRPLSPGEFSPLPGFARISPSGADD